MEIVDFRDLTFTYPGQSVPALDGVCLSVQKGEFFVLCGHSGCGKSTLLRHLKPSLAPTGIRSGTVLFGGEDLFGLSDRQTAAKIGFVRQSPERQIVSDLVSHELAFGLESLGADPALIRRRTAEMASFFGMEDIMHSETASLSGGQKQMICLAAVMTLSPDVIVLDEPTSQLDPVSASGFLQILGKINRELGTTVILSEHRLEEALTLAHRAAVMENGKIIASGTVAEVGLALKKTGSAMFAAMPSAMRIWGATDDGSACPVSVNEGRNFIASYLAEHPAKPLMPKTERAFGKTLVEADELWFRYTKNGADVIRGLSFTAHAGEIFCIAGGNGSGKTTTLKLIAGLQKPYRGCVRTGGRAALLPQDPQVLFVGKTVREDLEEALSLQGIGGKEAEEKIAYVTSLCGITRLTGRHPYDLSGGEQQRAALAKILLTSPDILLLDEPTKGLDAVFKKKLTALVRSLRDRGVCVIIVSHDPDFCAECADTCGLFFNGAFVTVEAPGEFFSGNGFYTTAANRMIREYEPNAVTVKEVIGVLGGREEEADEGESVPEESIIAAARPDKTKKILPLWRRIAAGVSAAAAAAVGVYAAKTGSLSDFLTSGGITAAGGKRLAVYAAVIGLIFLTALLLGKESGEKDRIKEPAEKRRLGKRTVISCVLLFLLIPVTLFAGVKLAHGKQYYFTALAVLAECMIPFFLVFEGRKPKAREIVTVATLCALSVAGRAVFFMLPQFKPVLAMTVIAGAAFGGETGFAVGAVSMLVSNMLFSQGPWTPWQMFAMGMVGFAAGVLCRRGILARSRGALAVFGAFAALVIYGGILNPTAVLIWGSETVNLKMILGYYITGFPMDAVHAASSAAFLWFAAEPMLEKTDRLKTRYGLSL